MIKTEGYTTEELVDRWEDQRQIKNLMGKYTLTCLLEKKAEIFDRFWSARQDVCYGVNDGWYSGEKAVRGYYDALAKRTDAESKLLKELFPEKLSKLPEESLYGVGHMDNRPYSTPVIAVAGDRETAKGMFTSLGCVVEFEEAGPANYWIWAVYAVDFVREAGQWKIWHFQDIEDIRVLAGRDWTNPPQERPALPEFSSLAAYKVPEPTVKEARYAHYYPERLPLDLPPLPAPYETFAETVSYGMEVSA